MSEIITADPMAALMIGVVALAAWCAAVADSAGARHPEQGNSHE